MKVSVLVPVYNTGKFLERCINSIITQTLEDIEIIIVNDGSTDNSLEILKIFSKKDKRIKIVNQENKGLTSARNTALKIANGKYCINVDSDDWIERDFLKKMYEKAEQDNLDIVISDIIFDFQNDRNYILKDLDIDNNKIISGEEYIKLFFKENFYGYTCNKLIKRNLYSNNSLYYNEEIFLLEDVQIILRLAYFSQKIGKINKAYYHYIQHQGNGTKKHGLKELKDLKNVVLSLKKFFEKTELNKIFQDNICYFFLNNIFEYNGEKNKEYLEIEEMFLNSLKSINFYKVKRKNKISTRLLFLNILILFPNKYNLSLLRKTYKKLVNYKLGITHEKK